MRRQNSPSMKVTGEGRQAHSWYECRGQQRGCSEPHRHAHRCHSRTATGHRQHSCTDLNSITHIFWVHVLTTYSVTRHGSSWPLFNLLLDIMACKSLLLLFSANKAIYLTGIGIINTVGQMSKQDTFLLQQFGACRWSTSTGYLIIPHNNIQILHHNNEYYIAPRFLVLQAVKLS